MRIAILTRSRLKGGGVESYLSNVIPELVKLGHQVAFVHEVDGFEQQGRIELPEEIPVWSLSQGVAERAFAELRDWRPDVIYSHSFSDTTLEAQALTIAPSVFFAHTYHGTCISGTKTHKSAPAMPCQRRFGWQCLVHYYPDHCGGWNPLTMLQDYNLQTRRLKLLGSYKAIMTNSEHMRAEYLKHGFAPEYVHKVALYASNEAMRSQASSQPRHSSETPAPLPSRLLFLGRMHYLKGGQLFLEALPKVSAVLGRPLHATFAGDGPERTTWERIAARLQDVNSELRINFTGWIDQSRVDALLADTDLLVVPSLWPEPFGLVGLEAGLYGVPAAAFAVGGIPDWLTDNLNGYLATGDPPSAAGLAEAIIKCLRDPSIHSSLRRGAFEVARKFSMNHHLQSLLKILETAAGERVG
jgi:glycosyltransferase involved in cell wall biosynthesis